MRISGGLGNQLFQYALGKSLALRNNTELVLDISWYTGAEACNPRREFELHHFALHVRTMSPANEQTLGLPPMSSASIMAKVRRRLFRLKESRKPLVERTFITEPHYHFSPYILAINHDCYLAGDWQSERYFNAHADIIRKEFTLKHPLSPSAQVFLERIKRTNSVALHIRRGDYAHAKATNALHGLCSPEYYAQAVTVITKTVLEPTLYIFSDDIAWAKENLTFPYPTIFVDDPSVPAYEALVLMSACAHQVIANSSFSWWAAWLNRNPEKIVVAPKQWFATNTIWTADLIPDSWIRV